MTSFQPFNDDIDTDLTEINELTFRLIDSVDSMTEDKLQLMHLHLWRTMASRVCDALRWDWFHVADCDDCWATISELTDQCLTGSLTLSDVSDMVKPTGDPMLKLTTEGDHS